MQEQYEKTKVLITVMTYPHPSKGYREIVCTAGITDKYEWVRLYPIDYRYRPRSQQFRKYQWIEIDLLPHGSGNDNRKESRRPDLNSIKLLGKPLSTTDLWRERKLIVDKLSCYTLNELKKLHAQDKTSLGIVKPTRVLDLKMEKIADSEWDSGWQTLLEQVTLFGPTPKPLEKLPYKFSYVFECEDSKKPHNAMIEDWELGLLFLSERDRLQSEEEAAESVKRKYFDEVCAGAKDTKLFMGTKFPYNTWLTVGVFCPSTDH